MGLEMEIKDLQQRLSAWGYQAADWQAEEAGLTLALHRAEAYGKRFCGAEAEVAPDLADILLNLAGAYYLQAKLAFGDDSLTGLAESGGGLGGNAISSIKLGDAAVSFGSSSSGSSGSENTLALQGFINETMQRCREALVAYRKIRF